MQKIAHLHALFEVGVKFSLDNKTYRTLCTSGKKVYVEDEHGVCHEMSLLALSGCVGKSLKFVMIEPEMVIASTLPQHSQNRPNSFAFPTPETAYLNPATRIKSYVLAIETLADDNPLAKHNIARAINKVAVELGEKKTPAVSTVARWYKQYLRERNMVLPLSKGGNGCTR